MTRMFIIFITLFTKKCRQRCEHYFIVLEPTEKHWTSDNFDGPWASSDSFHVKAIQVIPLALIECFFDDVVSYKLRLLSSFDIEWVRSTFFDISSSLSTFQLFKKSFGLLLNKTVAASLGVMCRNDLHLMWLECFRINNLWMRAYRTFQFK